jgi:predicted histone-like DNA-binding protein
MPISYNIVERGEPGVAGGGESKFYASAKTTGETNINKLIERIEKISTVSGADIRGVLYALVDVVPEEMAEGNIVRIGDLGSFRVSISSEGHDNEDDVSSNSVTDSRVIFSPGDKFDRMLNNLTFQPYNGA